MHNIGQGDEDEHECRIEQVQDLMLLDETNRALQRLGQPNIIANSDQER